MGPGRGSLFSISLVDSTSEGTVRVLLLVLSSSDLGIYTGKVQKNFNITTVITCSDKNSQTLERKKHIEMLAANNARASDSMKTAATAIPTRSQYRSLWLHLLT